MKLTTFFVARTKDNQAINNILKDSESTTKINAKSVWALFLILLTSAVIYKDFAWKRDCAIYLKLQRVSS